MLYTYPTPARAYLQDLNYSCGPCSLINVGLIKGQTPTFTEQQLCEICATDSATGTKPDGMIKGLEKMGLEVSQAKENGTLEEIRAALDDGHPVIVNYMHLYAGCGHYAVISSYDEQGFYLVDSALGLIRLDFDEFEKAWYDLETGRQKYFLSVE